MAFLSYEGVPDSILDEVHETTTGEHYTMRHNPNLKIEMKFLGKGKTNANAQGWERNADKYFNELLQKHPEMFSKKNVQRIQQNCAPIVDQKMIDYNPQWAEYRNQPLIHHHIGGNGEAVAVPKNMHKGSGEIHNYEKSAGITDKCKDFSSQCENFGNVEGKTTSELHVQFAKSVNGNKEASRIEAVQSAAKSNKQNSQVERIDLVKNTTDTNVNASPEERTKSVESSTLPCVGNSEGLNGANQQGVNISGVQKK